MALSLEIVARTLFGTDVTDEIRSINDEVNTIMGLYNYLIGLPNLEAYLNWPVPGVMKFRRARNRLNATVDRLIAQHKADFARTGEDKGDLLAMLLSSRDEEADAEGKHTGMSDQQSPRRGPYHLPRRLRDRSQRPHLDLVPPQPEPRSRSPDSTPNSTPSARKWVPRSDEVSPSLTWELASFQISPTGLPTLADYPNLKYTEQVFAEAMRLYPPAWAMGRMSTKPVTLGPWRIPPEPTSSSPSTSFTAAKSTSPTR